MKAASTRGTAAASIATSAALCSAGIAVIVAATAVFVAASGLSDDARHALGFGFGGVDRTTGEAAWIATHNAKYAAGALACALLVPWLPRWARLVSDYVLAAMLALNAGTIGVAFGAYRWRAVAATVPHLPVELAGLSLAGGAYLHARGQPLSARALVATTAGCASLLAAAAVIETYVSMGAAR
jgi:Stage II sporulation protein M